MSSVHDLACFEPTNWLLSRRLECSKICICSRVPGLVLSFTQKLDILVVSVLCLYIYYLWQLVPFVHCCRLLVGHQSARLEGPVVVSIEINGRRDRRLSQVHTHMGSCSGLHHLRCCISVPRARHSSAGKDLAEEEPNAIVSSLREVKRRVDASGVYLPIAYRFSRDNQSLLHTRKIYKSHVTL